MDAILLTALFRDFYDWFGILASIAVVSGASLAIARFSAKKVETNIQEMIDESVMTRNADFVAAEKSRSEAFQQVLDALLGSDGTPFNPHPTRGLIEKVDIIDEKADAAARTALVAVQKIDQFIKIWTPNGLDTNNFGDVVARMAQQQGAWLEDGVCDIKDLSPHVDDEYEE